MEKNEAYKYLCVEERDGSDNTLIKDKIVKEYYCRIRQTLKTELRATNKVIAINTLASRLGKTICRQECINSVL